MAPDNSDLLFSPSERIKQLNDIDRDVVQLLRSAGQAVEVLTGGDVSDGKVEPGKQSSSFEEPKEVFVTATRQYYSFLSSVDVRLRRQIHALKEAEILPAEVASRDSRAVLASSSGHLGMAKAGTAGGGMGNIDVGWLNSQNDNVGKEMEAELWEEASKFVNRLWKEPATNDQDHAQREDSQALPMPSSDSENIVNAEAVGGSKAYRSI
ncbi:hypothetical protein MMC21_000227 [Puttea exsequens]|nr:hypothetical protein [Puttea exsequens]